MFILSWVNNLSSNWSTILSACIQALGAVAAAVIAAVCANKIVNGFKYHSYSEAPDDICAILHKARSDIFIITAVGNKLLRKTEKTLEQKLRAGIRVRYLMLDENRFYEMEKYLHSEPKSTAIRYEALEVLTRLQKKYPDLVEVRFFPYYMTASYVGIDTCPDPARETALLSPFIQIMMYQYHIHAKSSSIWYCYRKTDQRFYESTVDSMREMWEDSCARMTGRTEA